MFDLVLKNINVATMREGEGFGIIKNACLAATNGIIAWIGAEKDLPESSAPVHDARGLWATPALIDCHTHLVYAGSRAEEFEQRLKGVSYADIAKAGGGIMSTVNATRAVSEEALYEAAFQRVQALMKEGVGALEIKSGYGLDLETERKMLRVATRLRDNTGLYIQRTFLGAHTVPPEYKGNADGYIDFICTTVLPALHAEGLVDTVDGFCETIGFTPAQIEKLFQKAKTLGLPVKLHAEQLSNQKGAALAAKYGALSADHIEYLDEDGVKAMASAETVAVLLPGAFYTLREKQVPPIDLLRAHNVRMAIATDHNPGTSPTLSPLLMMNMACTLFGLTPEEALAGTTRNAARALGIQDTHGTLEVSKIANIALWNISHPRDLSYVFGHNPCQGTFRRRISAS